MKQDLPQTIEQAVESLLKTMNREEIEMVKSCKSIYELLFSLGLHIRNTFRPYMGGNEALVKDCIRS